MKIELFLHPVYLSGISKNQCPVCAGINVRNQQEPVSALSKNCCPVLSGISVRFGQEYAHMTKKNLLCCTIVLQFKVMLKIGYAILTHMIVGEIVMK